MPKHKIFRIPKDEEKIYFDCGCIGTVEIVGKKLSPDYQPFTVYIEYFCTEHDPTLTRYAKEHEDEIYE